MGRAKEWVVRKQTVTITQPTGNGWTGAAAVKTLPNLGSKGTITRMVARFAAGGKATLCDLYIVDGANETGGAAPSTKNVLYKTTGIVPSLSATDATLDDNVLARGGGDYDISDGTGTGNSGYLTVAFNVGSNSGAGTSTIEVTVYARVQMS